MYVTLRYKTKDGKRKKSSKTITIKEATKWYNDKLKNDNNIIEVWLTHFGEWHEYYVKHLKKENE